MAKECFYYKEGIDWPTVLLEFPFEIYIRTGQGAYAYQLIGWCETNITQRFVFTYWNGLYWQIRFQNRTDIIMFRLKWGGEKEPI